VETRFVKLRRSRESSDLDYRLDNGGFQVLIQNGSVFNSASDALKTVDTLTEFKAVETREQTTTPSAEV
jgi:hypothetical protein